MSESECGRPVKKRKGCGNIKKIMKMARLRGEEFVTTGGKLVEQKITGQKCGCKNMCTEKFSTDIKSKIIRTVYSGRPKNEQDTYMMGLIERHDVTRHRPKSETSKQFTSSFKYFAMNDSTRIEVCRKAFLSLHAVSSKAVFHLSNLLAKGDTPRDMRGKHGSHNKIPNEVLNKMNEHIESFPKKTSHYSSIPMTYLETGLSVRAMHDMLIVKHPELNNLVKYEYFLNYYKENYGYRFGKPQV